MDQKELVTLFVGIGTIIASVLGIIVSNHKLKTQLVDDVKTPIKDMQKQVTEMKTSVTKMDEKVGALESKVNNVYKDMKVSDKLTGEALLSILRHRLTESGHKYIKLGYIVEDELEAFTNEYDAYTELGGNHYVTALYKKVMELPCRSIEEQEKKTAKKKAPSKKTPAEEVNIFA